MLGLGSPGEECSLSGPPQHFLYLQPLPQGQGTFRPIFTIAKITRTVPHAVEGGKLLVMGLMVFFAQWPPLPINPLVITSHFDVP